MKLVTKMKSPLPGVLLAGVLMAGAAVQAASPTVLLLDTFNAATPNINDLNTDLTRQSGTLAPITYTMAGGPGNYGHQLQNMNAPDQLLVADFPQSTSSLDHNFNGVTSAGGLVISFDLDSMPSVYGGTSDNWGCLNLGMGQADQLANVNQGVSHFGILFRAAGTIQAFDGGAVVSGASEPVYSTRPPGTTNHIDIVITDSDGNPFDGAGNTIIEVFANGGPLPVYTFTKVGGYANNYINVQGSFRAHFDNLQVAQLPADRAPVIVNPSFEADNFTVFPGYISGNGPITGWTGLGGHGVNPGTFGGPFSDNGKIPDGTKVAFLQQDGALSQVVSGFTIGTTYQLRYFENARSGNAPSAEVRMGGATILAAHLVTPVGGANAYYDTVSDPFIATASSMLLEFVKGNPSGSDTTLLIDNVSLASVNSKPVITTEPQDAYLVLGETATFKVAALGTAPLTYQWYFGNDLLSDATSRTLTVPTQFGDEAGGYYAVVTNPLGMSTSRVARLVFQEIVPSAFNTGVDALGVALPDGSVDPHYKLVVNPDNTGTDPLVEDSTRFPIVSGPWVANNAGSKWIGPRLETSGSAGGAGTAGNYLFRTIIDMTGYDTASAHVSGGWSSDNEGLDVILNGQSTGQGNPGQFGALAPFTLTALKDGLNTVDFKLNNSAVGYIGLKVDNFRVLATALPDGTKPFITQQPADTIVTINEQVNFSVRANGTGPLAYQWYFGPDALPGETAPTLSFVLEFPDMAGQYRVTVANAFGSVTSAPATLTVRQGPAILVPPASQVAAAGDDVTFTVSANGFEPLSYQWFKGETAIGGATETNLTLLGVTVADAGSYKVKVSNDAGSVTSAPVVLTVLLSVPGVFNTGVDDMGALLPDGTVDTHYTLVVNPDGTGAGPLVQDGTRFPINDHTWVHADDSKWIGPRFETSGSAGGDYVYRMNLNVTGYDLSSLRFVGEWATDNGGTDITINGNSTGTTSGGFGAFTPFTINTGFIDGANQVEFKLNNASLGYTGLQVRKLRVLAAPARARLSPPVLLGAGGVRLTWSAQDGKQYRLQFKNNLSDANWTNVAGDVTASGTSATKDDPTGGSGQRFYRVLEL